MRGLASVVLPLLVVACGGVMEGPSALADAGAFEVAVSIDGGTSTDAGTSAPDTASFPLDTPGPRPDTVAPVDEFVLAADADAIDLVPDLGLDLGTPDSGDTDAPPPEDVPLTADVAPDAGPPPPPKVSVGAPVAVTVQSVSVGAATTALGLPGDVVLVSASEASQLIDAKGKSAVVLAAGALRGAIATPAVLVAAGAGLLALDQGQLVVSPVSTYLAAGGATDVEAVPVTGGMDLYVADGGGLHRWHGGTLSKVAPDGLPTAGARLAFGPPWMGAPALWVVAGEVLYALLPDAAGLVAWTETPLAIPTDVAAAPEGKLVALVADGVHVRSADGVWAIGVLPGALQLAHAPGAAEVWIRTAAGLHVYAEAALHAVTGAPSEVTSLGQDAATRALALTATGVARLWLGAVPPPPKTSWKKDLEPLFQKRCASCHAPTGYAPTKLDTRDQWIANIDKITYMTTQGYMPLYGPALTQDELDLIAAWVAGGLLE